MVPTGGSYLVSGHDRESPTKGDWVGWVGSYDDIVRSGGSIPCEADGQHEGVATLPPWREVLPGGTFVATTYGHWSEGEAPYIVRVRFKLSELDHLANAPKADTRRTQAPASENRIVTVSDIDALRRSLFDASPATTIRIAPGTYRSGLSARGLRGEPGMPIVLEAADPGRASRLRGRRTGLHRTEPHVELRDLVVMGENPSATVAKESGYGHNE